MSLTQKTHGVGKTECLRERAKQNSLLNPRSNVRSLPKEITPNADTKDRVIFGNCLFDGEDGYYYMWTSCDSNEACGEDCYWQIPYQCAVAATVIGYCQDGCPAWAVQVCC